MNIVIIDYSLGNMFSVKQALDFCGQKPMISNRPEDVIHADAIVLPGVGAFGKAMEYLRAHGLDESIHEAVNRGKPFMGVCLGMQLVFDRSEEFGASEGLGLIAGSIKKFAAPREGVKMLVPQVGWNTIHPPRETSWEGTVLQGIPEGSYMYFVHSYYAIAADPLDVLAVTQYEGVEYCSAIRRGNISATQFHPEKSGPTGILVYKNWIKSIG